MTTQATILHGLFAKLVQRGLANAELGYGEPARDYLRLALQAQRQCAATWGVIPALVSLYSDGPHFLNQYRTG